MARGEGEGERKRERENSQGRKGDPRMNERAQSGPEPQLLSSSDINFQGEEGRTRRPIRREKKPREQRERRNPIYQCLSRARALSGYPGRSSFPCPSLSLSFLSFSVILGARITSPRKTSRSLSMPTIFVLENLKRSYD